MDAVVVPTPCVAVLVGPSGAGKSTWANAVFGEGAVVSADRLRALVGDGEHDLAASADAFELLELAVERRIGRGLTTVIDSLGNDAERRARWRELAGAHGMPSVCVVFDTPAETCRARNRERPDRVPVAVLDGQIRRHRELVPGLAGEGFDVHLVVRPDDPPARRAPARHEPTVSTTPAVSTSPAGAAGGAARPDHLRFGLQIPSYALGVAPADLGARLAQLASDAEAAGFASVWVMDHFRQIPMFGPPWHDMLESWTTLAHLAAASTRVSVGTLVTGVTHRNLAHLAKIVATVDVLSGGRAVCGIGAAWYAAEHEAYGLRFPSLAERYAALEDALELLPLMWGPGAPAYRGRTIDVPEAMCYPRPIAGRVPILVGGNGERRTLALAARYADACNVIGELDVVRRKVGVLGAHLDRFGRDRHAVHVTQLSTTLTAPTATALDELVARTRPPRVGPERWASRVNAATVPDQVTRFRRLHEAGVGEAIVSLPDIADPASIERFAAVIAAFAR